MSMTCKTLQVQMHLVTADGTFLGEDFFFCLCFQCLWKLHSL